MNASIFHKDFKPRPFWWEAHEPRPLPEIELPRETRVAIVGAGYAGLNAALELNREGIDCVVLDANEPGYGGSSRNGGMVSGGVNVGKRYMAKAMEPDEAAPYLADAADAFSHVEELINREKIDCGWTRAGYFLGAWCKSHYDGMAKKIDMLNRNARSEAFIVPPERQREEIGSDYYRGGMVVGRAGHLHPALFFKGILDLCQQRGIPIATKTPVVKLAQDGVKWRVDTPRGPIMAGDV
ncbi:MAG: FAD-binding oxidoreductase, partial [Alphaproteobacteria bacterium]|nr:FAD-binding oxidoreductase [Alphaproteobacteria bacterium]